MKNILFTLLLLIGLYGFSQTPQPTGTRYNNATKSDTISGKTRIPVLDANNILNKYTIVDSLPLNAPLTTNPDSLLIYTPQKRAAHIPYTNFEAKLKASFDEVYLQSADLANYVTTNTFQTITSIKIFDTGTDFTNIVSNNNDSGDGIFSTNSGSGIGIVSNNTGIGAGIHSTNSGSGRGIVSQGMFSSTGNIFEGRNVDTITYFVKKEGDVTANSFIKSGGTSDDVLLGDGSTTSLAGIGGGGGSDDQTASEVPFTPYSTIAATNVQDAIEEVLDEIPTSLAAANITVSPAIGGNTDVYAVMDDHEDRIDDLENDPQTEVIQIAAGNLTSDITSGMAKAYFRMPYAATLTDVRVSLLVAGTTTGITVDINENGTSVLSTKLTTDATEKTSTTATTPAVISDSSLADDAEMTIDFDAVPTGGKAPIVTLYLIRL